MSVRYHHSIRPARRNVCKIMNAPAEAKFVARICAMPNRVYDQKLVATTAEVDLAAPAVTKVPDVSVFNHLHSNLSLTICEHMKWSPKNLLQPIFDAWISSDFRFFFVWLQHHRQLALIAEIENAIPAKNVYSIKTPSAIIACAHENKHNTRTHTNEQTWQTFSVVQIDFDICVD